MRLLDSVARDTVADTLLVTSRRNAILFGKILDPHYTLLRDSVGIDAQVFRVGNKVRIGNGWTGYMLQGPEYYGGPGTIELWMYHPDSARFARPVCLASGWGDAGDSAEWISWLVDVDRDGVLDIVHGAYSSHTDINPEVPESPEPDEESFQVEVLRSLNGWFVREPDTGAFADVRRLFAERLLALIRQADSDYSDTIPSLIKLPVGDSTRGNVRALDKPTG